MVGRRVARGLALAAVVWCVAIGAWLWITPIRYNGAASTAYADSGGVVQQATYQVTGSRSFADVSLLGPLPLIIPLVLAAIGAWAVWRGRVIPAAIATGILLLFAILGGFSIGAGYVPAVAGLAWAVVALADT
jgi:hypothetical protein